MCDDEHPTGRFRVGPHEDDEPTGWRETFGQVHRRVRTSHEMQALRLLRAVVTCVTVAWLAIAAVAAMTFFLIRWLAGC